MVSSHDTETDKRPEWVIQREVSMGSFSCEGKDYDYTVVSCIPDGFLGFPNGEFLFISEAVPEEFRALMLSHEVREFTSLKDEKNKCLKSSELEFTDLVRDYDAVIFKLDI